MQLKDIEQAMNTPSFSISQCARVTGLHINTLYRIAQGKAKKPNTLTVEALEKYIQSIQA